MLHAATIVCLLVTLAATAAAVSALRYARTARSEDAGTARTRHHLLARWRCCSGRCRGWLFSAQWLPVFVLWPCGQI
jgi:hypothetical protein